MDKILFVKKDCDKCKWIKDNCKLRRIQVYDVGRADGLSLLAYYELVTIAKKKGLPILVYDRGTEAEYFEDIQDIAKELGVIYKKPETCDGDVCKI